MANKYIRHGETYCGDGTTSAAATSNGGVGAWNNINVLEGTAPAYGALAAGDVVYIRSKDNAGANITRTLAASATLGSASATSGAWITWVIDDGTVWSGIDGVITYECPSTYNVTLRTYNSYKSRTQDHLVIKETNASGNKNFVQYSGSVITDGLFIDMSLATSGNGDWLYQTSTAVVLHRRLHVKAAAHYYDLFRIDQYSKLTLIDPDIELTQVETRSGVFSAGDYGSTLTCFGGEIRGAGCTDAVSLVKLVYQRAGLHRFIGTKIPRVMKPVHAPIVSGNCRIEGVGLDGTSGAVIVEAWGDATSRSDGYFPTCNAMLPDSSGTTHWAWKIYPQSATELEPVTIPVQKIYTDTAAAKTVTLNFLVADTVSLANKSTMWVELEYTDATTGEKVTVSTYVPAGGALDAATATWSAYSWGAIHFNRYKISVTTPSNIKQDTPITVTLFSTWKSATAIDIMMLDPDLVLT